MSHVQYDFILWKDTGQAHKLKNAPVLSDLNFLLMSLVDYITSLSCLFLSLIYVRMYFIMNENR